MEGIIKALLLPYSQPSKKKPPFTEGRWEEAEEGEQANLFEESPPPSQPLVNGQPQQPKEKRQKAEQANLFEEQANLSEEKKEVRKNDDDEKGYAPGETVELDF